MRPRKPNFEQTGPRVISLSPSRLHALLFEFLFYFFKTRQQRNTAQLRLAAMSKVTPVTPRLGRRAGEAEVVALFERLKNKTKPKKARQTIVKFR